MAAATAAARASAGRSSPGPSQMQRTSSALSILRSPSWLTSSFLLASNRAGTNRDDEEESPRRSDNTIRTLSNVGTAIDEEEEEQQEGGDGGEMTRYRRMPPRSTTTTPSTLTTTPSRTSEKFSSGSSNADDKNDSPDTPVISNIASSAQKPGGMPKTKDSKDKEKPSPESGESSTSPLMAQVLMLANRAPSDDDQQSKPVAANAAADAAASSPSAGEEDVEEKEEGKSNDDDSGGTTEGSSSLVAGDGFLVLADSHTQATDAEALEEDGDRRQQRQSAAATTEAAAASSDSESNHYSSSPGGVDAGRGNRGSSEDRRTEPNNLPLSVGDASMTSGDGDHLDVPIPRDGFLVSGTTTDTTSGREGGEQRNRLHSMTTDEEEESEMAQEEVSLSLEGAGTDLPAPLLSSLQHARQEGAPSSPQISHRDSIGPLGLSANMMTNLIASDGFLITEGDESTLMTSATEDMSSSPGTASSQPMVVDRRPSRPLSQPSSNNDDDQEELAAEAMIRTSGGTSSSSQQRSEEEFVRAVARSFGAPPFPPPAMSSFSSSLLTSDITGDNDEGDGGEEGRDSNNSGTLQSTFSWSRVIDGAGSHSVPSTGDGAAEESASTAIPSDGFLVASSLGDTISNPSQPATAARSEQETQTAEGDDRRNNEDMKSDSSSGKGSELWAAAEAAVAAAVAEEVEELIRQSSSDTNRVSEEKAAKDPSAVREGDTSPQEGNDDDIRKSEGDEGDNNEDDDDWAFRIAAEEAAAAAIAVVSSSSRSASSRDDIRPNRAEADAANLSDLEARIRSLSNAYARSGLPAAWPTAATTPQSSMSREWPMSSFSNNSSSDNKSSSAVELRVNALTSDESLSQITAPSLERQTLDQMGRQRTSWADTVNTFSTMASMSDNRRMTAGMTPISKDGFLVTSEDELTSSRSMAWNTTEGGSSSKGNSTLFTEDSPAFKAKLYSLQKEDSAFFTNMSSSASNSGDSDVVLAAMLSAAAERHMAPSVVEESVISSIYTEDSPAVSLISSSRGSSTPLSKRTPTSSNETDQSPAKQVKKTSADRRRQASTSPAELEFLGTAQSQGPVRATSADISPVASLSEGQRRQSSLPKKDKHTLAVKSASARQGSSRAPSPPSPTDQQSFFSSFIVLPSDAAVEAMEGGMQEQQAVEPPTLPKLAPSERQGAVKVLRGSKKVLQKAVSKISSGSRSTNKPLPPEVLYDELEGESSRDPDSVEPLFENPTGPPHKTFPLCCKCSRKIFVFSVILFLGIGLIGLVTWLVLRPDGATPEQVTDLPDQEDKVEGPEEGENKSPGAGMPLVPPSPAPTAVPTLSPTDAPFDIGQPGLTIVRPTPSASNSGKKARITNLVSAVSGDATQDITTPQGKALAWMTDADEMNLPSEDSLVIQRYIFALLYYTLDGNQWSTPAGRYLNTSSSECKWAEGIKCVRGRVRHLNLTDAGLSGQLPHEITHLKTLTKLNLHSNAILGVMPHSIGNLDKLNLLDLSMNRLSGEIPTSVGNLTQLSYLDLHSNIRLRGAIPHTVSQLKKLVQLSLDENSLQGSIPHLRDLTRLEILELDGNKLTGRIPPSIGRLTALQVLKLHNNILSGPIPKRVGILAKLRELHLYKNRLTGVIPSDLGRLRSLEFLSLFENLLTGEIPPSLGNLGALKSCALDSNMLMGSMPEGVCALTRKTRGGSGGELKFLSADCAGDEPEVQCECCSTCHATSLA